MRSLSARVISILTVRDGAKIKIVNWQWHCRFSPIVCQISSCEDWKVDWLQRNIDRWRSSRKSEVACSHRSHACRWCWYYNWAVCSWKALQDHSEGDPEYSYCVEGDCILEGAAKVEVMSSELLQFVRFVYGALHDVAIPSEFVDIDVENAPAPENFLLVTMN